MLTENMKKAIKAVEADEELKAKIEALEGADDAVAQAIAIMAEHGCTLTEEDFAVLTDEDFQETGNVALSLDDLDAAAGGKAVRGAIGQRLFAQVAVIVD